jgi:hypothetical protein
LAQAALVLQQQAHLFMEMLVVPLYLMPYLLEHLRGVLLLLAVVEAVLHQFLLLKMADQAAAVLVAAEVIPVVQELLGKETLVVMVYPALNMVLVAVAVQALLG